MNPNDAWLIVPLVILGLILGSGFCAFCCAVFTHGTGMELPGHFQAIGGGRFHGSSRKRDGFQSLEGKTIEVDMVVEAS